MGQQICVKGFDGHLYELILRHCTAACSEIARIEKRYSNPMGEEEIFELLRNFNISSRRGVRWQGLETIPIGSLSNCFVIGNEGLADHTEVS